jgi:type II secretory pathway component PulF
MHFIASLMTLLDTDTSSPASGMALGAFFAAYGIFLLIILIISIVIYWRIAMKAGYPGAYSLLLLIPLVNLIVILMFAFSQWPIERELAALRGGSGRPMTPVT